MSKGGSELLSGCLLILVLLFVVACIKGFIIWLLWPIIFKIFPGLVGAVIAQPTLWQAILFSWLCECIFGSSTSSSLSKS